MADFPTTIILAGGLATRLGDRAKYTPKSMLEVAGEPFVAHQLRLLKREGVRKVVFCVAHLSKQIEEFVGDGSKFDMDVSYSYDGEKLLGTGGAVKKALPKVEDRFAIIYGDSYLDFYFPPAYELFLESGKPALMTVLANNDQWDKSNVVLEGEEVRVYDKKNPTDEMHHIDYGLSILKKSVLNDYPENEPFDLADVFTQLAKEGKLAGYEVCQRFYEIGSETGLADTDSYIRNKLNQ